MLVEAVAEELARRQSVADPTSCVPVRARLSSEGSRYAVMIEDAWGRRTERQVASVQLVATLIETWMVSGIEEPVVEPTLSTPVVPPTPPVRPTHSRLVLSVQGEGALADDRSLWVGLGAMMCLRLGRLCPGALVRFADDEGWADGGNGPPEARRSLSALGVGSAIISIGPLRLLPRIGVGIARTWDGQLKGRHEDGGSDNRGWLRAEAGITGQILVRDQWALSLDLLGELAPLALESRLSNPRELHEPWIFYRLGLGVAWGTR
jgi:hypothetical protein